MGLLEGRIAVITGGGRGMGATEAKLFAREGATVVVCDILAAEGESVVAEIAAAGGKAHFRPLDVAQPDSWADITDYLTRDFGKVHVLVNNAGITHRAGTVGTSLDDWQRVLGINLTGAFIGIKSITPLMREAGGGAILNVASIAGLTGYHSVSYGTSKWGLIGLTKASAMEFVDWNIRINAICPGIVETPLAMGSSANYETVSSFMPLKRPGKPEEIAELVLFLVSDKASFITGEAIAIDGGMMATALFGHIARRTGVFEAPER